MLFILIIGLLIFEQFEIYVKIPTVIVSVSVSYCNSVNVCFMYFEFMVYLPGDLILSAADNTFCRQVYAVTLINTAR